jgi:hypothetical protein
VAARAQQAIAEAGLDGDRARGVVELEAAHGQLLLPALGDQRDHGGARVAGDGEEVRHFVGHAIAGEADPRQIGVDGVACVALARGNGEEHDVADDDALGALGRGDEAGIGRVQAGGDDGRLGRFEAAVGERSQRALLDVVLGDAAEPARDGGEGVVLDAGERDGGGAMRGELRLRPARAQRGDEIA